MKIPYHFVSFYMLKNLTVYHSLNKLRLKLFVSIAQPSTVFLRCFSILFTNCNDDDGNFFLSLAVIDAWGKIPSGILSGNVYELGQFDECLSTDKPIENEETTVLKGQYCLAQLSIQRDAGTTRLFDELSAKRQLKKEPKLKGSDARLLPAQQQELELSFFFFKYFNGRATSRKYFFCFIFIRTFGLNIGICVPDSCRPGTMTQILNYALNASNISAVGLVSKDFCQTNKKAEFNTLDIVTM